MSSRSSSSPNTVKKKYAKMVFNIITNTPITSLNERHKIASVEKDVQSLSPLKLSNMNDDLLKKIILKELPSVIKYEILDWIPKDKLDSTLSLNPNAIDFLSLPGNKGYIDYPKLSLNTNPDAVKLLCDKMNEDEDALKKGLDVNALKKEKNKIAWLSVAKNTHLIKIYNHKKEITDGEWERLSKNPKAIKLLFKNKAKINLKELSGNISKKAIEYLITKINEDKRYRKDILWTLLSANTCSDAIDFLKKKENYKEIVWEQLSENTNAEAIKLLEMRWKDDKCKGKGISWYAVSKNISASSLLREKIDEEKLLKEKDYKKLKDNQKVSWVNLSGNPGSGIIELLKENEEKIVWKSLCGNINPGAIDLLIDRLKVKSDDIDWKELSGSQNPRAIDLLYTNQDKIIWSEFSKNQSPKAMELLEKREHIEKELLKNGMYNSLEDKISWSSLLQNPSIFTLNLQKV